MTAKSIRILILIFAVGLLTGVGAMAQFPSIPSPPSTPDIPDVDDITDVVDDLTDLENILGNLAAYGLGMDGGGEMITTSLDDAVYDMPFLDDYPHAPIMDDIYFRPIDEIPRGTTSGNFIMPGRYMYTIQSFCLHAGTHGPGHGDGYLWAPLKGPWADIFIDILRNSEMHPEFTQQEIQSFIWSVQSHTRITDMSPEYLALARALLSPEQLLTINGGAFEAIPQNLMGDVFGQIDVPPVLRQTMRAQSEIRSMMTGGYGSFADLEAIAVLDGDAPFQEGDRVIPAERWSYHPNGYFVRYEPHGYSSNDVEIVYPDLCMVDANSAGEIFAIEDEHSNRLDIDNEVITFTCLDPMDPYETQSESWNGYNAQMQYNERWASEHRAEVQRLCGMVPGVDDIVRIGELYQAFSLMTVGPDNASLMEQKAMDLIQEAWMHSIIALMMSKVDEDLIAMSKDLPEFDWRDRWRESDDSEGTATPGDRLRQRLAGRRDPRPSEDPDWGEPWSKMPEFDPDKNPAATDARESMNDFNNVSDTLSWLESGPGNIANTVGFAIPNAVFNGLMEFTMTLWDYCTGAIASEPPRRDFDIIAAPEQFEFAPLMASAEIPQARVDAANALMADGLRLGGILKAAVISIDRQGGAQWMGDQYWAFEQAKATVCYERMAGWAMYDVADSLDAYFDQLRAEGYTDLYITPEDAADRQERLRNEGFTQEQLAGAYKLGLSDTIIDNYYEYRISIDPNEVAGSLFESAAELSASLRHYGNYLISLPDAEMEDLPGFTNWVSP